MSEERDAPDSQGAVGVPELLAAAVGAGLQLSTTGTAATVVGALVPPALVAAYRLDEMTRERRAARAARTLEVAAEELHVELPELERMALRDESTTSLVARVMAASANAVTAQHKVEVLGRVLATGLGADDRVDEALLLAAALDDLDAPHVRTLTSLGEVAFDFEGEEHWSYMEHGREWRTMQQVRTTGAEHLAPALVAVLVRHGLAEQKTQDRQGVNGVERHEVYAITELGTSLLVMLDVPVPQGASGMWRLKPNAYAAPPPTARG